MNHIFLISVRHFFKTDAFYVTYICALYYYFMYMCALVLQIIQILV